MPTNNAFISFHGITKRFPGVLALDGVSFKVARGSCQALVGENGAGKSTLGKILAGVYVADEGEVHLDGQRVHTPNPLAARKLGIAMVHQELAFCPNLTVAENLCLGDLPARAGWLDRRFMNSAARAQTCTWRGRTANTISQGLSASKHISKHINYKSLDFRRRAGELKPEQCWRRGGDGRFSFLGAVVCGILTAWASDARRGNAPSSFYFSMT